MVRDLQKSLRLSSLVVLGLLAACAGGTPAPEVSSTAPDSPAVPAPSTATSPQIVGLHTRLMVAGLACGPVWQDPNAYRLYAGFTVRHAGILRHAQQDMASRLGGMAAFDQRHTAMSNEESMRARVQGVAAYCAERQAEFYSATSASPGELPGLIVGL